MYFPSAVLTNSITNGLHALILSVYFCGSLYHYFKTKKIKSIYVVIAFFCLFVDKILGVIVHYFVNLLSLPAYECLWTTISLILIVMNYSFLYGQQIPDLPRRAAFLFSTFLSVFFIFDGYFIDPLHNYNFVYLAASFLSVYGLAICYSKKGVRLGFIAVVFSNIFWLLARTLVDLFIIDLDVHYQYTYDNDLYHLMLIASTSILYVSILRGDWMYPEKYKIF